MNNNLKKGLFSAFVIVVLMLMVVFLKPNATNDTSTKESVNNTSTTEVVPNTTTNFDYILPSEWDGLERAEKNIQSLGEGQRAQFGIVQDPTDENIVYFASSAFNVENQENLVSIYKYNTSDYSFDRLFRGTYAEGGSSLLGKNSTLELHIVGYDSGKLLVLAEDTDDSPGPCSQPLLLGMGHDDVRNLVSMDLSDPYDGFKEYDLPKEITNEYLNKQETCQDELSVSAQ